MNGLVNYTKEPKKEGEVTRAVLSTHSGDSVKYGAAGKEIVRDGEAW